MKITIPTCDIKFRKKCTQHWGKLQETESETTRFCTSCEKNVYYVKTDEEALHHAEQGHCIAKEMIQRSERVMVLGQPKIPISQKERELMEEDSLEGKKNLALSNLRYTDLRCSECSYPIFPTWREKCLVCNATVSK